MSRVGKQIINIPSGVEVSFNDNKVIVKGNKGTLERVLRDEITFKVEGGVISSEPRRNDKLSRSLWGTYMSLIKSMVKGVSEGFERKLTVEGVGFKWEVKGDKVHFALGFSHPVTKDIPNGIAVKCEKSEMTVTGIDKEAVSRFAMEVKRLKKPEPYKGKGIRYTGETIRRKEVKKS